MPLNHSFYNFNGNASTNLKINAKEVCGERVQAPQLWANLLHGICTCIAYERKTSRCVQVHPMLFFDEVGGKL